MKTLTKVSSVVCAILLAASMLAGCSNKTKTTSTDSDSLTFWGVMDVTSSRNLSSYSDMLMYQEMEKRTGIKVDFIHPIDGSTGNEAFLTMLSGSELPDIIEYNWSTYNGGAQAAIDDGVIVELNDYLEEYAPNYYDYMEGEKGKANNYLYKYQATTSEGNYYGFNRLNIGTARTFDTFYVRADLLEKWGMSVPETIDDWSALFAKAKSEGFEIPFTGSKSLTSNQSTAISFHNAFGVGSSFYLNDKNEVVFAPFEKGYKEFLAQMAEWVKLGYIDKGYITNDTEAVIDKVVNGRAIASIGGIGGHIGKILPAGQSLNPDFMIVACPYPVAKKGDKIEYLTLTGEATAVSNAITTQCTNLEKAMQWCDYVYSEEGFLLQTFGIEGDTYTVEETDGEKHYVYTEKITNPEKSGVENVSEALYKYMLPANHPGLDQHPDYLENYYKYESQKEALKIINSDIENAKNHVLPTLNFTSDESERKTDIEMVAFDALEVALTDIVLGKTSIDTFEDAIKEAKINGYDELLEIYQTAYDRYMAKFE